MTSAEAALPKGGSGGRGRTIGRHASVVCQEGRQHKALTPTSRFQEGGPFKHAEHLGKLVGGCTSFLFVPYWKTSAPGLTTHSVILQANSENTERIIHLCRGGVHLPLCYRTVEGGLRGTHWPMTDPFSAAIRFSWTFKSLLILFRRTDIDSHSRFP